MRPEIDMPRLIDSITLASIRAARDRISPYIRKTPLLPFDASIGDTREILLKWETAQFTGSFKLRGATNCILQNLDRARKAGVIAASAGNHAQGVAAISNRLQVKATIVMPATTPPIKVDNTRKWGAAVVLHGEVYDDAFEHAQKLAQEHGYLFVHPFRDADVISGQGTIGLELLEEPAMADVEAVVISIGGGGLITGCATALKALRPKIKIYGVMAKHAPTAFESFKKGEAIEHGVRPTLADGIAMRRTDPQMLECLKVLVDDVFLVSEESIASAIAVLAERAKLVAEGAGAIPLAAILEGQIPEKKIATVLCGGNIDLPALAHVLERGLAEQGRLVRFCIRIPDRPGSLSAVTQAIGEKGGNILQVFHQRSSLRAAIGETFLEIDLETRGRENTEEIAALLTQRGYHVERL